MPQGQTEASEREAAGTRQGTPLIIVESPSKARTLERYLGGRYLVRASMGAIRDLPKSDLGIDEANDFEQTYVVISGKEKVMRDLKAEAKKASRVILGTDPDREGEAISWHLAKELKLQDPQRVRFEEITRSGVEKALAEAGPIDTNLVNAQIARRVIDRLVGYKVSPVLWRKVKPSISAGRVQSVAVRLVCEREEEIDAFVAREYWTIEADLRRPGRQPDFKARLLTAKPSEGAVDERKEAADEADATAEGSRPELADEASATAVLEQLRQGTYTVASVEVRERASNPRAPYETSTLQQDASNRIRFSPRKAMQVAQQLYEGVDLGAEGPSGLITYMRTDDTRVSNEAVGAAQAWIRQSYGEDYAQARTWGKKKGAAPVEAQGAHEAIRPTDVTRTPESVEQYLTNDQLRLYTLIWRRYMASQMAPARYENTRVDITAAGYTLRANGSIRRFDGFERVWEREVDDDPGIPELAAGDLLDLLDLASEQHFTQPPPRYTEASLIKELEERGIGRPSTYAPTIDTIERRGYVRAVERRLHPTPLGKAVNAFMVANFGGLVEYGFTANMEGDLDKIENGTAWVPFMRTFNSDLDDSLAKATDAEPVRPTAMAERTGEICPKCGEGELVKRAGRFGEFVGCSRYPACDYIKDREDRPAAVETGKACPTCGKPLVMRQSRRGPFIGCSGYPDCRYTEQVEGGAPGTANRPEPKVLDEACPVCGKPMVMRRGRFGEFKSCSDYPKCKGPARAGTTSRKRTAKKS